VLCSSLVTRTRHVHGNCCISAGKDNVPTVSAVQLQQWQWMRCSCSCCCCCTMEPNASPKDAWSRVVLPCHNCPNHPADFSARLSGSPCWWVNRCLNVEWLDDCAARLQPKDDKLPGPTVCNSAGASGWFILRSNSLVSRTPLSFLWIISALASAMSLITLMSFV